MHFSYIPFRLAALACVLGLSLPCAAHEFKIGPLVLVHPAAPASLPGQTGAVIFLTIENTAKTTERLIKLASPMAENVMIHEMVMAGSIMKMREIDGLVIPPAAKVAMIKGSPHHIMMTRIKQPLVVGDKIPLVLTFERAGTVEVVVNVERSAVEQGLGNSPASHRH